MRIFWIFILVIGALAVYATYVVVTLPALRVHTIDVRIDGRAVSEAQVLAAARIDRERNVWLLNTAQIAQRIEVIPYVGNASVRRVLPARIVVGVTEREPAACVRSGKRIVTIDRSRRILQAGCIQAGVMQIGLANGTLGVPGSIADQPQVAALLEDGRTLRDANIDVRLVHEDRFGQLVAVSRAGIVLLFGSDSDVAQKAKLVAPILAAAQPGRLIRTVDLRASATPIVEFANK